MISEKRFAILVAVLSALHALLWAYLIPPAQAPDEESHFAYVEFLATQKRMPIAGRDFNLTLNWRDAIEAIGFSRVRLETFQLPSFVGVKDGHPEGALCPGGAYNSGSPGGPPLYYFLALPTYVAASAAPVLSRLYAVRMMGVVMAALMTYFSYRALVLAASDGLTARAGALAVALHPMAHFLCGYVTTDHAALAAAAGMTCLLVSSLGRPPTVSRCAGIGLMCGLLFLIKPFLVSFTLPAAAVIAASAWRAGGRRWVAAAGIAAVVALITVIPWILWARQHYGGLTGFATWNTGARPGIAAIIRGYLEIASPWALFSQANGVFGWLDAPLPREWRAMIAVIFAGGWLGFGIACGRGRISAPAALLAGIAIAHTLVTAGAIIWTTHSTGYRVGVQGRYFLAPIVAWIGPCLIGWTHLLPRKFSIDRWIVIGAAMTAAYALGRVMLVRYYL